MQNVYMNPGPTLTNWTGTGMKHIHSYPLSQKNSKNYRPDHTETLSHTHTLKLRLKTHSKTQPQLTTLRHKPATHEHTTNMEGLHKKLFFPIYQLKQTHTNRHTTTNKHRYTPTHEHTPRTYTHTCTYQLLPHRFNPQIL